MAARTASADSESGAKDPSESNVRAAKTSPFANLRDITLVCTIYLFFAGYVYRYFMFIGLGIPSDVNEAPVNTLLVYAFGVLFGIPWWFWLVVTLLFLGVVIFSSRFVLAEPLRLLFISLLVFLAFPAIYFAAQRGAQTEVNAILGFQAGIRPAYIAFASNVVGKYSHPLLEASNSGTAYIVHENKEFLFILVEPKVLNDIPGTPLLYIVPRTHIDHVRKVLE